MTCIVLPKGCLTEVFVPKVENDSEKEAKSEKKSDEIKDQAENKEQIENKNDKNEL